MEPSDLTGLPDHALKQMIAALREENARLKEVIRREAWLEHASENDTPGPYVPWDQHSTMMEENALLRSVLKRIAGDGCGMATKPDEPCHKLYVREDDWCWCCIARQALAREEK